MSGLEDETNVTGGDQLLTANIFTMLNSTNDGGDDGGVRAGDLLTGDNGLTNFQLNIIVAAATIAACLSLWGSFSIIHMTKFNKKRETSYHRLMVGLSTGDIFFSISGMLQPYLQVKESGYLPTAIGTFPTCTFVGLCTLWASTTVAIYSSSISVNFVVSVVFGLKNDKVRRYYERYVHYVAWLLPAAFGIPAAVLETFSPEEVTMICVMDTYPSGCTWDEAELELLGDAGIPCTRGKYEWLFDPIYLLALAVPVIAGWICNAWLYISFRRKIRANQRYDFEDSVMSQSGHSRGRGAVGNVLARSIHSITNRSGTNRSGTNRSGTNLSNGSRSDTNLSNTNRSNRSMTESSDFYDNTADDNASRASSYFASSMAGRTSRRRRRKNPVQRALAYRCVFYSLAFLNTAIWPVIFKIMADFTSTESNSEVSTVHYVILLVGATSYPLQGFLNMCIYILPQLRAWKKEAPYLNLLQRYVRIIRGENPTVRIGAGGRRGSGRGRTADSAYSDDSTPSFAFPSSRPIRVESGVAVSTLAGGHPESILEVDCCSDDDDDGDNNANIHDMNTKVDGEVIGEYGKDTNELSFAEDDDCYDDVDDDATGIQGNVKVDTNSGTKTTADVSQTHYRDLEILESAPEETNSSTIPAITTATTTRTTVVQHNESELVEGAIEK